MKLIGSKFKRTGGLLACMLICGVTIVGANQAIQAIQNTEIKVNLNGQVQSFKDETTGETQYPITYHDRTYLPLRNVAQIAGLKVDYDNNTKTAILESQTNSNEYRGDNVEGKYFWNYDSLKGHEEEIYLISSDNGDIIKENTHNNMAASVIKRYPENWILQIIVANQLEYDGDGAGWYYKKSNYDFDDLLKYDKPIEYKVAACHNYAQFIIDLAKNGKESNTYKTIEDIIKELNEGMQLNYDIKDMEEELRQYDILINEMNSDSELKRLLSESDEIEYSMELEAYVTAKYTENYQFMPPKPNIKKYFIDTITFMNGNNTTIDNYYDNARAKKIKITLNESEYIINLDDTPEFQNIYLGWETEEYTKPVNVKIEVLEKYNGRKTNDVYFSGISIQISNNFVSFAI